MDSLILDYSDYVEMACLEHDATYYWYPSVADVRRTAYRFLDPSDVPSNPRAVPYEYYERVSLRYSEYERSRYEIFGQWYHYSACPYCKSDLVVTNEAVESLAPRVETLVLRVCPNCGWWDFEEELTVEKDAAGSYWGKSVHRRAILREYSIAGTEAPIESLLEHITRHPNQLSQISPKGLEQLVGAVFSEYMSCEAIHVGGPSDNGIDLILIDGNRRYVVQVKRRQSPRKAEAVSGIREFLGAMVLDGTLKGLFVSTAHHFSKNAVATVQKAQKRGIVEYIGLVSAKRLIDVCRLTASQSQPAWKRHVSKAQQLPSHAESGQHAFISLAMGNPDWRLSSER